MIILSLTISVQQQKRFRVSSHAKKLDTDKELINQGDGALVSRGTLPNLEKRVEISASTELRKGMCFLLSLGASPIPTFSIFTKSLI